MAATGRLRRVGLLPAAGMARRLGIATPKELLVHAGRPVIDHSVAHLLDSGVDAIVVVTRAGKEPLDAHLRGTWGGVVELEFVVQQPPIGNLLDALRTARPAIAGHEVELLFPDTVLTPNPFAHRSAPDCELTLFCHDAAENEAWRHFGVVDRATPRVVEKPTTWQGSSWCWGAARWRPRFTDRLATAEHLTEAVNAALRDGAWEAVRTIDRYEDVGLGPSSIAD